MSLSDLADLSQIIAAVAVVASLIYLAVQVGQKLTSAQYCAEYRAFVENNIINRPVAAPADAFGAWRALVSEELGSQE